MRVLWPLRFLVAFWTQVIVATFSIVFWPVRALAARAKRERWGDPR